VDGAVHMLFLDNVIGNAYQNLSNIILTITPAELSTAKGVLVASHYDSLIGSPGEGPGAAVQDLLSMPRWRIIHGQHDVEGSEARLFVRGWVLQQTDAVTAGGRLPQQHGAASTGCALRRCIRLRLADCGHAGGGPDAGGGPQHQAGGADRVPV